MELRDLSHHRPIIWSKNPECDYVLSITPIMDLGVRHPILRRVHFAKKEVHPCDDLSLDPKGDGDITAPAHVVCGGSTPCHAMLCYGMLCHASRAPPTVCFTATKNDDNDEDDDDDDRHSLNAIDCRCSGRARQARARQTEEGAYRTND